MAHATSALKLIVFFFNDTATTEIYTLSLHDALPIALSGLNRLEASVAYAHPDVLVSTDWVVGHRADPAVRLIEVDVDTTAYDSGHIAGAVGWNWQSQLNDPVRRDIPDKKAFAKLLSEAGMP